MGWGCGGVKVLPLLGGFSCKVYISSVTPRFYFRKHAFCFLPLATILESLKLFLKKVMIYLREGVCKMQRLE
jgi:hypothetical protein